MMPLGPGASARQTPISDRFMLGGPSSLRGFHANCIGPVGERRGAPSQVLMRCGDMPLSPHEAMHSKL